MEEKTTIWNPNGMSHYLVGFLKVFICFSSILVGFYMFLSSILAASIPQLEALGPSCACAAALNRSLFIYIYGIRLIQVVNIKPVLRCFNCSFTACHIVVTSTYGPLLSFLPRALNKDLGHTVRVVGIAFLDKRALGVGWSGFPVPAASLPPSPSDYILKGALQPWNTGSQHKLQDPFVQFWQNPLSHYIYIYIP